jgi:polyhydroxybutyrate depolymerase
MCAMLLVACAPQVRAGAHAATIPGSRLSPACSASEVAPTPQRLIVDGRERTFLAHLPEAADRRPRDLVIAFHGRTNDAARARRYFHLDEALPDAIIVYPRALSTGPGTFAWSAPGDPPDRLRDFALVDAIIEAFGRAHCIDEGRVFVVGHSLGASFANDVACHLGDRIRAVASVAGGIQGPACVGGAAALILHHPDDLLVPIGEGERVRDAFRAANGLLEASATPATHPDLVELRCVRHGADDVVDPVVWCPHDDATGPAGRTYAHTWPDGAAAAIGAFVESVR